MNEIHYLQSMLRIWSRTFSSFEIIRFDLRGDNGQNYLVNLDQNLVRLEQKIVSTLVFLFEACTPPHLDKIILTCVGIKPEF
jgi:hypothetical protein